MAWHGRQASANEIYRNVMASAPITRGRAWRRAEDRAAWLQRAAAPRASAAWHAGVRARAAAVQNVCARAHMGKCDVGRPGRGFCACARRSINGRGPAYRRAVVM